MRLIHKSVGCDSCARTTMCDSCARTAMCEWCFSIGGKVQKCGLAKLCAHNFPYTLI